MNDAMISHRSDDAVISVQQDNAQRSVVILGANSKALELLGVDREDELLKASLYSLLDPRTRDTISSYLEYSDEGTDLSDVVSKMREFVLLDRQNNAIRVQPKVFRTTSQKGSLNYTILIRDTSITQKLDAFRKEKLPEGSKYSIDSNLGILDEPSTNVEVSIVLDFARKFSVDIVLSIVALDQKHSNSNEKNEVIRALSDALSANIRYTDILGHLSENKFIFVLLGCNSSHARAAISRIHGGVSEKLSLLSPSATVSFAYSATPPTTYSALLTNLEQSLLSTQQNGGGRATELHL